jgi:hypothetical protein
MRSRSRTLSVEDRKAVDVFLDHAVLDQAASVGKPPLTRLVTPVQQRRLTAAKKLLALLSLMPEIDPPADLVSRTLRKIDQNKLHQTPRSSPSAVSNTLH